jgi:subtilisin family serine protease
MEHGKRNAKSGVHAEETPLSEMPMDEFIASPTTVDFQSVYSPYIHDYGENVRLGTVLNGNIVVGYAPESEMDQIYADLGIEAARATPTLYTLLDKIALDRSDITAVQNQTQLDLRGGGVVIGFVDTGIDFTSESFIYENNESKIHYIWDQTETQGSIEREFNYGAVYTNDAINNALNSKDPKAVIPHRDTVGHGTFLASVAAGRAVKSNIGAAPDAGIIMVKLRQARPFYYDFYQVDPDLENVYESTDIMQGIEFIIRRADELGAPVVICISIGSNSGNVDGETFLSEYIRTLSLRIRTVFVAAAGNEGAAAHHAYGRLEKKGEDQELGVKVAENIKGFSLEIWNDDWDKIAVSIRSPSGEVFNRLPIRAESTFNKRFILEPTSVEVRYRKFIDHMTFIVFRNPTPGIWTVILHAEVVVNGEYDAWLPITGIAPEGLEFVTYSPYDTIVNPAVAGPVITCGAYNARDDSISPNSSWGSEFYPSRSYVDIAAPGVSVGGVFPNGSGAMSGTSVAAAITSGAMALIMQWAVINLKEPNMSGSHVKSITIRGCSRNEGMRYPSPQWGYGRLNLFRTFALMRELPLDFSV